MTHSYTTSGDLTIAMSGLQHGTAYAAVDAEGGSGALTGQADGEELKLGTQERVTQGWLPMLEQVEHLSTRRAEEG